jgi:hypothetical protein
MRLNLTTRHLGRRPALLDLAQRRAAYALDRFDALVRRVELRLEDVNGPRGGNDVSCLALATLTHGGQVLVTGLAATPEAGVTTTLDRLAQRLRRWTARHSTR